jgi:NTE family protein
MDAYAILDGGGVKGAALAGCLKAAEEQGVTFHGYGGTSAGALVATLAAVGYSPDELRQILADLKFTTFLDDGGVALARLRRLSSTIRNPLRAWSNYRFISKMIAKLGLYHGDALRAFLREKIGGKLPNLRGRPDVTFKDLQDNGCVPLKIVATDLGSREPRIYSATGSLEDEASVLDAVRASASYPFVFRPVQVNTRYLVDGGLCSNLPVFLFEAERINKPLTVIAFDLVQKSPLRAGAYTFADFCGDMLASALESGDFVLRSVVRNIYHVQVRVPEGISTLDFELDDAKTEALYNAGMAAAHSFFAKIVPQWAQAKNDVERLQAQTGVSNELVAPVLETIGLEFERRTHARSVRVSITLPTIRGTRIVAYQFGMDDDPDIDLELDMASGCSGRAWVTKRPAAADLMAARDNYLEEWGMRREQQNKVRADRQSMMSFPIFDLTNPAGGTSVDELPLIGVLSVDSETPLSDTGWVGEHRDAAVRVGTRWADVLSRMLT